MTRPYDVTKDSQLLGMESDNFPPEPDKWSILHSGDHVSIHPPRGGGYYTIPRKQFNALVDWYMRDQPTRAKPKRKLKTA